MAKTFYAIAFSAMVLLSSSVAMATTKPPTTTNNTTNYNNSADAKATATANANLQAIIKAGGGNASSIANGGNATATGGTANSNSVSQGGVGVGLGGSATGGNATGGAGGSGGAGGGGGTASAVGNVNTSVNVEGNDVAAASAYAPALVAGDDTCMGSTTGGAQGIGFGVSLGSTYTDDDCVRRKDATFLHNIGLTNAAVALMCQKDDVKKAIAQTRDPGLLALCGNAVRPNAVSQPTTDRPRTPADRAGVSRGLNE